MGSLSLPKLPIIDFSNDKSLQPGTDSWSRTGKNVTQALEEYGCFVATYDKVSLDLHKAIIHEMEGLFDLPVDVKAKNASERPYHGYSGIHTAIPLLEGLGIDNGTSLESIQSFAKLMWQDGNERFCDATLLFSERVSELERLVRRMVFESYGAQKHYESHVGSSNYLLRFMKYRPPADHKNEASIGCHVHTDKSLITILHQNEVSGLEVQTREGEWIGFDPSPTSFIVMTGDAFMAWSNGRIHSPTHRVVMKSGIKGARYSIGMFAFHTGVIRIPPELADDEHPLQFKDFEHYGLLRYFSALAPEDQTVASAKAYCGI